MREIIKTVSEHKISVGHKEEMQNILAETQSCEIGACFRTNQR
jgi:hypothetical protein